MNKIRNKTRIASAVKRVGLCAATTALLASAGSASAVEVKVGGYVKVDAIYDLDADLGPSLDASAVPTGAGVSSDPSFQMHALQSRLNVSATEGDLMVFMEGDFFGGGGSELVSNSRHFRLRHAYGKMGNFLAGQTWSTFMDANWVLYPATVDFGGPAGATFIRQAQFRWTLNDGLDLAIENPENRVEGETTRDTVPDIILRYARAGNVSWQVAGLAQQFEVDGGTADGETETNFGATAGVNFKIGDNSISVKANVNSNRYTYYGFSNPAAVVVGGTIETIDHSAVVAAYNHSWGGGARTTIAYGMVDFDTDFLSATDIDNISTFHINYRWNPHEQVEYGAEISMADQELVNGDDGDATRLQFAVKYDF